MIHIRLKNIPPPPSSHTSYLQHWGILNHLSGMVNPRLIHHYPGQRWSHFRLCSCLRSKTGASYWLLDLHCRIQIRRTSSDVLNTSMHRLGRSHDWMWKEISLPTIINLLFMRETTSKSIVLDYKVL